MYRLYTSDNGFIFVFDGLRTLVLEGILTIDEKYSWFLANIEMHTHMLHVWYIYIIYQHFP